MKAYIALILLMATTLTGDTLQSIALDYQETPNLQRFAEWSKTYSNTGIKCYEWQYVGERYADQIHTEKTITTVTKYVDGVFLWRTVSEVSNKEIIGYKKPYLPRQYWVEQPETTTVTIDDLIKNALADPNGFPVEVLYKLKELK
jgi:hypothetical protein